MKTLLRNLRTFWYCLYDGKVELEDGDGNVTGDYAVQYQDPVALRGNISTARGTVQDEVFGQDISYDRVIILDDPNCPIDENTVLFVDKEPEMVSDGTVSRPLFDYVVRRVARSLNSVAYAIERADVT